MNNDLPYFYCHITKMMDDLGLESIDPNDLFDVTTDHIGKGYGLATQDVHGECDQNPLITTGSCLGFAHTTA